MVDHWMIFDQMLGGRCALCRAPGDVLCPACRAELPDNGARCPVCALPLALPPGATLPCAACQAAPPAFDRALAPLLYRPPVDRLVTGFKYHQQLHWGRALADILADRVAISDPGPELLIPLPTTPARLRQRGFNQAAELARRLSGRLAIPWRPDRLLRVRDADHQQRLDRRRRLANVRTAFTCRGPLPSRVVLVDDVITTGATAQAASATLRGAGVEWIEVWAVARTPWDRGG